MLRYLTTLLLATAAWAQFQTAQQYPAASYPPYQNSAPVYQNQNPGYQDQRADERDWAADQQHGVARVSIAQGDVNVKRGDNGQLTGAVVNAPLMARDHVETGPGSRAEVQFDAANLVRLGPDTDLGFATLAYQRYQVQLGIGTLIVRVLRDSQAQLEIDTPSVSFRPVGQGEYRISVYDNGTSQITVRAGRVEMSGPRGAQMVNAGQSLVVRGEAGDPEFQQAYETPRDQLDDWSAIRDNELLSSRSYQYVSADINGAEDLDRYGTWVPSEYGQVWAPQVQSADWSPYSNGQWTWADYYGWTWVGYEPWGWAPYHYGRWFWNTSHGGWCWWPGERGGYGYRWSPALVSFFGFGGGLGWVSLGPRESYHPWWGRGYRPYDSFRGYDLNRYYRNAGVRGGAMTAGFSSFAGAGHSYRVATRGQIGGAELYRGHVPITPNAGGYRFSERPVGSNPRFSQFSSRPFYSPSRQQPSSGGARSSWGGAATPRGGWQSFGSPGSYAPTAGRPRASQDFSSRGNDSGWHSFGRPSAAPMQQAPRYEYNRTAPRYNYSAPQQRYNAPSYSAPPSQHYNAPAPRYSAPAPRSNGGGWNGGGGGRSGGGNGGRSSGGGGGHRSR